MPPRAAPVVRKKSSRQSQAQAVAFSHAGSVPPEQIARRKKRHLDELERSNYTEPKFAIISGEGNEGEQGTAKDRMRSTISDKKRKSSVAVRRVLLYRKNLATLLEEFSSSMSSTSSGPTYLTAVAPVPPTPRRPFCSVCGYWGNYSCQKCGMHYCTISCRATHDETRCEKRIV
ncbi:hypothetical protein BS47DRAFT_1380604 [Hydnum rufescens UP504]|uniref:HIT-type domain-containing protein n=1 Tax=Hydnum rufescens UP504 TaxID=1448309 RepID=A0A9P6B3X8_9AGAM|nr:hypothetical protein BS47DRAFT_1380604 [Hydnum rufescens UP504]